MKLDELLSWAVDQKASDLHLSSDMPPMVRVDGDINRLSDSVLSSRDVKRLVESAMTEAQMATWQENHEIDFSYNVANLSRFRVNAFLQSRGPSAAFRMVPSRVKSLDELEAPGVFRSISR
jgi:twitching motility protein PilT